MGMFLSRSGAFSQVQSFAKSKRERNGRERGRGREREQVGDALTQTLKIVEYVETYENGKH